jgi:PPOX class probable F420-dependent enzyme
MATMTREEAIEFLGVGTRTGRLATASRQGTPHVAPVWFVVDSDDLVFTTGFETVKGRHLRTNPRAAMTVDLDEFPYHFVVVRGPVTVQEHPEEYPDNFLHWATKLAQRYVPPSQAKEYGRRNAVPGEMLCRLSMRRIAGVRDVAV